MRVVYDIGDEICDKRHPESRGKIFAFNMAETRPLVEYGIKVRVPDGSGEIYIYYWITEDNVETVLVKGMVCKCPACGREHGFPSCRVGEFL